MPNFENPTINQSEEQKIKQSELTLEGLAALAKEIDLRNDPEMKAMDTFEKWQKEVHARADADELDAKDVVSVRQPSPSEKAPTMRNSRPVQEHVPTIKTDKTLELESANRATLRNLNNDYLDYDAAFNRVEGWLSRLEVMMEKSNNLAELSDLKLQVEKALKKVKSSVDLEEYAKSKQPGAAPFKIELPEGWLELEARLNSLEHGHTLREVEPLKAEIADTVKAPKSPTELADTARLSPEN